MVSRKHKRKHRYSRKTNKKYRNRSMKKNRIARKTRKNRLKYVMKGGAEGSVQIDQTVVHFRYNDGANIADVEEEVTALYANWKEARGNNITGDDFVKWSNLTGKKTTWVNYHWR